MLDKNKVEKFINAALKYEGDKYSQPRRMEKGYSDCSSLIYKGLRDSKLLDNSKTTRTISTKYMGVDNPRDPRFKLIEMKDLQRGDILWGGSYVNGSWSGHVAIYMGNNKTFEAVKAGVKYMTNRPYFTRAYRIKTLEATAQKPVEKPSIKPTVKQNVSIYLNSKLLSKRGYIIDGITFLEVDELTIPVRRIFEKLGFKVEYKDEKVYIS